MLPFNADNLQEDDVPPPLSEDADDTDEAGGEVAPVLSDEAVEALDQLGEHRNDPAETAETTG